MCTSTGNSDSFIFLFWEYCHFLNLEIWPKLKILHQKFVSTTPLKPLNRISWNLVVMKDIICRYAFLQQMLIWSFISLLNFGQNYFVQLRWNWFSVQLPITNASNCHLLYTAFSGNVGAWGMWACSLFLSFNLNLRCGIHLYKVCTYIVFDFLQFFFYENTTFKMHLNLNASFVM